MIQMICGVFGLPVTDGDRKTVKAMDKDSGPFNAGEEQEKRLVALGIAEYVYDAPPIGFDETPPVDPNADHDEETGENHDEETGADDEDLPVGVIEIPEYSVENTAEQLREIGNLCGLEFKPNMKKQDMVDALDAHIAANMVDGAEIDEDGELAPVFDASEAVQ